MSAITDIQYGYTSVKMGSGNEVGMFTVKACRACHLLAAWYSAVTECANAKISNALKSIGRPMAPYGWNCVRR